MDIDEILTSKHSLEQKIESLEVIRNELNTLEIENAIEDVLGEYIRLASTEEVIEEQKKIFARLFDVIDHTLSWNEELQQSMYGVINRASLRAMLKDPEVSVKTKEEIMNNWEDFM
ncbi:MAG: hypothetical protein INQ03_19885 [Candidatus Heimdallarchaeota archaeon]|nr:hypothetical protein [Candidatus Heimdallarchaeota archaeon]